LYFYVTAFTKVQVIGSVDYLNRSSFWLESVDFQSKTVDIVL